MDRNTLLLLVEVPPDDCKKPDAVMGKQLPIAAVCRYVSMDALLLGYMGAPIPSPYHNFDEYIRKVVFEEAPDA